MQRYAQRKVPQIKVKILLVAIPCGPRWLLLYFATEFLVNTIKHDWLYWTSGLEQSLAYGASNAKPNCSIVQQNWNCSWRNLSPRTIIGTFLTLFRIVSHYSLDRMKWMLFFFHNTHIILMTWIDEVLVVSVSKTDLFPFMRCWPRLIVQDHMALVHMLQDHMVPLIILKNILSLNKLQDHFWKAYCPRTI